MSNWSLYIRGSHLPPTIIKNGVACSGGGNLPVTTTHALHPRFRGWILIMPGFLWSYSSSGWSLTFQAHKHRTKTKITEHRPEQAYYTDTRYSITRIFTLPARSVHIRLWPVLRLLLLIGCLRFTTLCWVGKHVNVIMKPTNSPTQGQPRPRKVRFKVAFGPLFPTESIFSWVGIGFIWGTDYEKPNPTIPQTP